MTTDPFRLPGEPPVQRESGPPAGPKAPPRRARRTWVLVPVALIVGGAVGYVVGGRGIGPIAADAGPVAAESVTPDSCLSALNLALSRSTDSPEFQVAADDCRSRPGGGGSQLGQPASDGAFTFVVDDVSCGEISLGRGELVAVEAQGMFCQVKVTVSNDGNSARELIGSAQKLIDEQGRVHDHSDDAALTVDDAPFFEQINPGNQVEATLVFDVPRDTEVAALELHDSLDSGGVRIAVP